MSEETIALTVELRAIEAELENADDIGQVARLRARRDALLAQLKLGRQVRGQKRMKIRGAA
jgi:hypothetical protein